MSHNQWIDISVAVREGMPVWPGDLCPPGTRHDMDQANGDVCTLTRASMSAHTGTHMDAPLHFVRDSPTIEQMPIDATVGPARVIRIMDGTSIHKAELLQHSIQSGERILFRTTNSDRDWGALPFNEEFVFIASNT